MRQWRVPHRAGTVGSITVVDPQSPDDLSAEHLREMTAHLLTELHHRQALNEKLTHANEPLKCLTFAAQSERVRPEQRSLLDDRIDADLATIAHESEQFRTPAASQDKSSPMPVAAGESAPERDSP